MANMRTENEGSHFRIVVPEFGDELKTEGREAYYRGLLGKPIILDLTACQCLDAQWIRFFHDLSKEGNLKVRGEGGDFWKTSRALGYEFDRIVEYETRDELVLAVHKSYWDRAGRVERCDEPDTYGFRHVIMTSKGEEVLYFRIARGKVEGPFLSLAVVTELGQKHGIGISTLLKTLFPQLPNRFERDEIV